MGSGKFLGIHGGLLRPVGVNWFYGDWNMVQDPSGGNWFSVTVRRQTALDAFVLESRCSEELINHCFHFARN